MAEIGTKVGLCYLARGADRDWQRSSQRFAEAYRRFAIGWDHALYVIYKGFGSAAELDRARGVFAAVDHTPIDVADDRFDIGAYFDAVPSITERIVCFLNSFSEPMCDKWLAKMAVNFQQPGVGLVGASGSFEGGANPEVFPNIHIRSNAFIIERAIFATIASTFDFRTKQDAYMFESGPNGMTRQIRARGLKALVVGRNGRGYAPQWWPSSDTFRQGRQSNLLVADNQTRDFDVLTWAEKAALANAAWGPYLQEESVLRWKD
jgi:hypothetical protein